MYRVLAGVVAFGVLLFMASTDKISDLTAGGQDRDRVFAISADSVLSVAFGRADRVAHYVKRNGDWLMEGGAFSEAATTQIDAALALTENARSVRMFLPEEIMQWSAEAFGLAPDPLTVSIEQPDRPPTIIRFGHATPDGNLQYMQRNNSANLYVMSGHLGQAWAALAGLR